MIDDAEFARRIRMIRAYLDLTLDEASEELDVAPSTLSRRENADTNGAKLRTADRFHTAAVYCRISGWPAEFFTDETMPPIPRPGELLDDLEPGDVIELVESPETSPQDHDGGTAEA